MRAEGRDGERGSPARHGNGSRCHSAVVPRDTTLSSPRAAALQLRCTSVTLGRLIAALTLRSADNTMQVTVLLIALAAVSAAATSIRGVSTVDGDSTWDCHIDAPGASDVFNVGDQMQIKWSGSDCPTAPECITLLLALNSCDGFDDCDLDVSPEGSYLADCHPFSGTSATYTVPGIPGQGSGPPQGWMVVLMASVTKEDRVDEYVNPYDEYMCEKSLNDGGHGNYPCTISDEFTINQPTQQGTASPMK